MNSSPDSRSNVDGCDALSAQTLVTAFLAHVPDVVFFKDRQSRFIAVSASLAAKHGLATPADTIGKTDFDFLNEQNARVFFEEEQRMMLTGEPVQEKLEKESWADGHVTWSLYSKMPLRNESGQIVGTFGISKDVTKTKEMEFALEKARSDLIDASRLAGMAEVATSVLHNVGNVVNSLNVSANVISSDLRKLKLDHLSRVCALLRDHTADLAHFLAEDEKGQRIPGYLEFLASHLTDSRTALLEEVSSMMKHVEHVMEIVARQQAYATMRGVVESLEAATLMEDSLRMNAGSLTRHCVRVAREFQPVPPVVAERGKVLQILVNLIRNAKDACDTGTPADKLIVLRIEPGEPGHVRLIISDNGVGIPPENLTRIFNHGFSTRVGGHGFGLHSSALAAREMKGRLTVHSDGPDKGATFTLELPAGTAEAETR